MSRIGPRRPALVLALLANVPALAAASLLWADPAPDSAGASPLRFTPPVEVAPGVPGAEPGLVLSPDGCIFLHAVLERGLWNSCGGRPFIRLEPPQTGEADPIGAGAGLGGLDSDVVLDAVGTLFHADLWLGSVTVAASQDGGRTWALSDTVAFKVPVVDRPWLAPLGAGEALLVASQVPSGIAASRCRLEERLVPAVVCDAPVPVATSASRACVCAPGRPASTPGGIVLVPYAAVDVHGVTGTTLRHVPEVRAAISLDRGLTWSTSVVARGFGSPNLAIFPVAVFDGSGRAHVAWAGERGRGNGWEVWLASSEDGGATWPEDATRVSAGGTNALAWIAAGGGDALAVAWYHSDERASPEAVAGAWRVDLAKLDGRGGAAPASRLATVSARPVHVGSLCISGASCDDGRDRDLLDFLGVAVDSGGRAHVAFADDASDGHDGHAHVLYSMEIG